MEIPKRTLELSEVNFVNWTDCAKYYGLNKSTIINMAIRHGIEQLNRGYLPVRTHKKRIKKKAEIYLSNETWCEFYKAKDKILDRNSKPISDGELVDRFLEIELKKYMNAMFANKEERRHRNDNEKEYKSDSKNSKKEPMTIEIEIPKYLVDEIDRIHQMIGVGKKQLWQYLFVNGILQEEEYGDIHYINTDRELVDEMEKLGLNEFKASTLLKYLQKSGRIIWTRSGENGNE